MNKHTNPFHTIEEAMSILKSLGADPLKPRTAVQSNSNSNSNSNSGATYPFPWGHLQPKETNEPVLDPNVFHGFAYEPSVDWREEIMSITTHMVHDSNGSGFKFMVHISNKGFDALLQILGRDRGEMYPVRKELCFVDYDSYTVEPSPGLEICKLELREEPEVPICDCGTQN